MRVHSRQKGSESNTHKEGHCTPQGLKKERRKERNKDRKKEKENTRKIRSIVAVHQVEKARKLCNGRRSHCVIARLTSHSFLRGVMLQPSPSSRTLQNSPEGFFLQP